MEVQIEIHQLYKTVMAPTHMPNTTVNAAVSMGVENESGASGDAALEPLWRSCQGQITRQSVEETLTRCWSQR